MARAKKYVKALPKKMVDNYVESMESDEPLHMKEEIALLDARLIQIVSELDSQVNSVFWRELAAMYQSLETACYEENVSVVRARLRDIRDKMNVGIRETSAWESVRVIVDQRNKMVREERRHQINTETLYTVREGMTLVNALLASVRTHVRDEEALAAIREDFLELTATQAMTQSVPTAMGMSGAVSNLLEG